MDQSSQGFLEILLRPENVLTMFGVWVFIGAIGKLLPGFSGSALGARLQPLAPLGVCQLAVWIPGLQPNAMGIGARIMLALVLGFGVGHVHKVLKQTGFGDDERIQKGEIPWASRLQK